MDVNAPVLDARDLYRFFHAGDDEVLALRGVSLQVERGEFVAIAGPSGSGKSTLLACLAGLDDPDAGMVTVDGRRMSRRSEPDRAALRATAVGLLFQSHNLIEHLTVSENVALCRRLGPGSSEPVGDLLDQLDIGHRASALPSTLSGGEASRAGLAVALANDPVILLADEPTGEIDGVTEARVLRALRRTADLGRAVVVVTHSSQVTSTADRVIRLIDGVVS